MQTQPAVDLTGMSEAQLLAFAEQRHADAQAAELDLLRAAYQWAVVHHTARPEDLDGRPGSERARQLGGAGTPLVGEFAAAAFGARIGRSPYAAARLIGDAQDIYLRLPELASRVEEGEVRVSYARHVADRTRDLTEGEAAYVDHEVAESADGRLPWTRFETLVEGKVAAAAPETARRKEEQAAKARFAKKVRTEAHGMATFMIRADVATIDQIDAAVTDGAATLQESMPGATQDERRVRACLLLANPTADPGADLSDLTPQVQLYLHCYATEGTPDGGIGRLEGHGPVTEAWIGRVLAPSTRIRLSPVLDLAGQAPVDAYEIPQRHRQAVRLMTPSDAFPFASSTSRDTDIDHTIPFAEGGPSAIGNYGPLTRRHHRLKTHGRWQVRQPFPGLYVWRDPYGATYLVDHTGTRRVPDGDRPRRC